VIEILTSHAFNTIQDLGRTGARRFGVSTSGAMDPVAVAAGNALLGNDVGAASIEVQTFPFRLRFGADIAFALTGAAPFRRGGACGQRRETLSRSRPQGAVRGPI
jgi:allophanate hydrolase subunit 2